MYRKIVDYDSVALRSNPNKPFASHEQRKTICAQFTNRSVRRDNETSLILSAERYQKRRRPRQLFIQKCLYYNYVLMRSSADSNFIDSHNPDALE